MLRVPSLPYLEVSTHHYHIFTYPTWTIEPSYHTFTLFYQTTLPSLYHIHHPTLLCKSCVKTVKRPMTEKLRANKAESTHPQNTCKAQINRIPNRESTTSFDLKPVRCLQYMSHLMTKPTKCSVRPAKTQIHLVWSESSQCTQWVAKVPMLLYADGEESDQTGHMTRLDLSLRWAHRSFGWFCHAVLKLQYCRVNVVMFCLHFF